MSVNEAYEKHRISLYNISCDFLRFSPLSCVKVKANKIIMSIRNKKSRLNFQVDKYGLLRSVRIFNTVLQANAGVAFLTVHS